MALLIAFPTIFLFWLAVHRVLESKVTSLKLAWTRVLWFFMLPLMFFVGTLVAIDVEASTPPVNSTH